MKQVNSVLCNSNFVRDFLHVGLFQPAGSSLGKEPGLLTSCIPKRRDPLDLAQSAEQMPHSRQRPWDFCNIPGNLPVSQLVLTIHKSLSPL